MQRVQLRSNRQVVLILDISPCGTMDLPLRFMTLMSGGAITVAMVEGLVEMLNGHFLRGLRMILKK